jgi:hypothetical protein
MTTPSPITALSILSGLFYIPVELLLENEDLIDLVKSGASLKDLSDFVNENY